MERYQRTTVSVNRERSCLITKVKSCCTCRPHRTQGNGKKSEPSGRHLSVGQIRQKKGFNLQEGVKIRPWSRNTSRDPMSPDLPCPRLMRASEEEWRRWCLHDSRSPSNSWLLRRTVRPALHLKAPSRLLGPQESSSSSFLLGFTGTPLDSDVGA